VYQRRTAGHTPWQYPRISDRTRKDFWTSYQDEYSPLHVLAFNKRAMSSACAIESPYTLVSLPRPFDASTGKTHAVPIYGYTAQKRRKRAEAAVSVDGESISLWNVGDEINEPCQTRANCLVDTKPSNDCFLRCFTSNSLSLSSMLNLSKKRPKPSVSAPYIRRYAK